MSIRRVLRKSFAIIVCSLCVSWVLSGCGNSSSGNLETSTGAVTSEALSEPGPFVAGFQFIKYVDKTREADTGGRPVPVFFFYPADPKTVTATTPLASYPLDPLYGTNPEVSASEYVAVGDDPAYAGVPPSRKKGPFPLVVFSPGSQFDANQYIYVGTRLATQGIAVAIATHRGEAIFSIPSDPWFPGSLQAVNRAKDMSFALTSLLGDPRTRDVFNASQVVAAGHSFGGYTAWLVAGGDDNACDTFEWFYGEKMPEETCVPIAPDPRFKGVISQDGSNEFLSATELARVRVPTLNIGEDEAALIASSGTPGFNARPHAFIGARTSYRVDVNHAAHTSFADACATFDIFTRAGVYPNDNMTQEVIDFLKGYYCVCPTPVLNGDCVIDAPLGHNLTTKYMTAFINAYVAHGPGRNLLVPKCGQKQEANIELFTTEVGGDHHVGPDLGWLAPFLSNEQFDYYVHQADVPCED